MPLSWNDPATRLAQAKYAQSVRPDAPWCPDNIEFIRRINGLGSLDDVHRIVHEAAYLVLGLGDVYLGAPVATPVDPRHRLVTTKYNPARTWTPENAVGIGGAYMCVYGMEGPGGYQLVGRTVQVWNTYRTTKTFVAGVPWSLRFFDQIRFYPVSTEELQDLRRDILHGAFELKLEESEFNLIRYQAFLKSIQPEIAAFKSRQSQAFLEERERWRVNGQLEVPGLPDMPGLVQVEYEVPQGCEAVSAPMTASVFQIAVEPGQRVAAGQKLVVLDAMKTELVIAAPVAGVVDRILCQRGQMVSAGQQLAILCLDGGGK
jgi:urea carboxylase